MTNGWEESAAAWIQSLGERGDYAREFVLDRPMLQRARLRPYRQVLDVGCGEGRFVRRLTQSGVTVIGIDPTQALIHRAREQDPEGDYRVGRAEKLEFHDSSFDLVVSYLSLIDIPDIRSAIQEMARVLRPGGTLLIANLTSFNTAGPPTGWTRDSGGELRFYIDHYLDERVQWIGWKGIRIQNWHRPLSTYMSLLLQQNLQLRYFDEPPAVGGDPAKAAKYRRVPWFLVMEWQKG